MKQVTLACSKPGWSRQDPTLNESQSSKLLSTPNAVLVTALLPQKLGLFMALVSRRVFCWTAVTSWSLEETRASTTLQAGTEKLKLPVG